MDKYSPQRSCPPHCFYNRSQISYFAMPVFLLFQFLVNVREHLETPEFVFPTFEGNHEFYVYVQSTWTVRMYAKAAENT